MTMNTELSREMEAVEAVIQRAQADLAAGRAVDVSPLEGRISVLCEHLAAVPPEDSQAVQPRVLALIDDFSHLAREIESRMAELKEVLKDTSGRARALNAYGSAPRPDKPKR